MNKRGKWQGMLAIAQFNWPFYVAAVAVLMVSLAGFLLMSAFPSRLVCVLAFAGAGYFLFGSLGVSHLIYDRSDLHRYGWLERATKGCPMRQCIFCHSGFDEMSQALREKLADAEWQILDHFNEAQLTEASIHRARRMFPPTAVTLPAAFNRWPVSAKSADAVFGLLAIHEFRRESERGEWFREARRCLKDGGRVVLVEHVRDLANFLAFGPGFFHFHSRGSWRRSWECAGFSVVDEFRITPWLRVFVLVPR